MKSEKINRASGKTMLVLSLIALTTVFLGLWQPPQPASADEGALAHIFQLSVVAAGAMLLVFLSTADWKRPAQNARTLAVPAGVLAMAFAALYYLEHIR